MATTVPHKLYSHRDTRNQNQEANIIFSTLHDYNQTNTNNKLVL